MKKILVAILIILLIVNFNFKSEGEDIIVYNSLNSSKILLVNKDNPLDKTYEPQNLVKAKYSGDKIVYLEEIAAINLEKMIEDAKNDNIDLLLISGYRDYDYQTKVYNNSIKNKGQEHTNSYVAKPGESEHQTGLAMDVATLEFSNLDDKFSDTKEAKWLHENMHKYGFILRYPKGKENITGYNYEPWHIRYVGIEAAKEIYLNNQTLEEYLTDF